MLVHGVAPAWLGLGIPGQSVLALERAAAIHRARGEHTEAIRILAEQVAPFFESTRDARNLGRVRAELAATYRARDGAGDRATPGQRAS